MNITIYGKKDCTKCSEARRILPDAIYKDYMTIHDDFDMNAANAVITASNGQLPIIIIETDLGRMQLSSSAAVLKCKDGSCTI